jgi:hypothetical protein
MSRRFVSIIVFNHRKDADGKPPSDFARFDAAVRKIAGKRLTFDQLTGKEATAHSL